MTSSSSSTKYSRGRVSTFQDTSAPVKMMIAVSSIIGTESPSTPSEYDTPSDGIHGIFSANWKPPAVRS